MAKKIPKVATPPSTRNQEQTGNSSGTRHQPFNSTQSDARPAEMHAQNVPTSRNSNEPQSDPINLTEKQNEIK